MNIKDISVSIIQTELIWENAEENLKHFDNLIDKIDKQTDIIVLPEMFTTGFSMNPENLYDTEDGKTLKWMKLKSKQKDAAVVGSVIIKEDNSFYNRLFFVKPDGSYLSYDKKHLFTLAGEHEHYNAGTKRLIVEYKGWRFCPLICYDLRFPVWARYQGDYDVLIYVSNWPKMRIDAWDALLKARAIENMAYSIGVNRIGDDGNAYPYVGHSAIYDPLGKHISQEENESEFIDTQVLSYSYLNDIRNKLGFLNDRDEFRLG